MWFLRTIFLIVVFVVGAHASVFRSGNGKDANNGGQMAGRNIPLTSEQIKAIISTVKECMSYKQKNRKWKKDIAKKAIFTFMSGHTLERLAGFPPMYIKQVQYLTECVQEHVPYLFVDR